LKEKGNALVGFLENADFEYAKDDDSSMWDKIERMVRKDWNEIIKQLEAK